MCVIIPCYQVYYEHGRKFSCSYDFILVHILATSTTLSPLGMVSVCPGGQILLTCERMSGSFLHWNVSIPRLAMSREIIVARQGDISTIAQQFNGLHATEFTITRTSDSPLISQMLINNVTTEINGSTIYCSEDGDENGAPAVEINVIYYYGIKINDVMIIVNDLMFYKE